MQLLPFFASINQLLLKQQKNGKQSYLLFVDWLSSSWARHLGLLMRHLTVNGKHMCQMADRKSEQPMLVDNAATSAWHIFTGPGQLATALWPGEWLTVAKGKTIATTSLWWCSMPSTDEAQCHLALTTIWLQPKNSCLNVIGPCKLLLAADM